jgi:hypothetical protein
MAGPSFNFGQYPTDNSGVAGGPDVQATRWFDASQAIPNTGINGGSGMPTAETVQPGLMPTSVPLGQATGTGITGTGAQSPQAYFQSKYPAGTQLSPQMLLANEADLKAHGITLIKNAEGQPGKIQLSDGSAFDVIQGAGTGNGISQWNQIAGPGGVPTGGGGTLGSIGGTNQFGQSSGFMTAPIGLFTPPTAQDALNSPGLQFALEEANRMGQNSGAAHGTLLNGRFQQALNASNIQNALGGFNDVYNRAANAYGINYQTQTGNQDRPFAKYSTLATLGSNAAAAS